MLAARSIGFRSVVRNNLRQNSCYSKYPFLADLGIERENNGVFHGEWKAGNGDPITSYNPTTNEPIATVFQASVKDYEEVIGRMNECHEKWMTTPAPVR